MKRIPLIAVFATLFCLSAQAQTGAAKPNNVIFPTGKPAPAKNFTGNVWLHMLAQADPALNCSVGNVTFAPAARSNWHTHPAGQILLITAGTCFYQEKGKPIQAFKSGEVIKCLPDVEHWHGASPDSRMTHIAINPDTQKGIVTWLKPVTDAAYQNFKN